MSRQALLLLFKGVTLAYSSGAIETARNILIVISSIMPGVSLNINPTGNNKYPHINVNTSEGSYEGIDYVMHVYEGVED